MKRRDRNVVAEECPKCGARTGEKCRNYQGKGKQPCRLEVKPPPAKDLKRLMDVPLQQAELFDDSDDAVASCMDVPHGFLF